MKIKHFVFLFSLQQDTESNDQHIAIVDMNAPDDAGGINVEASTSRQPNEGTVLDNLCNTGEKSSISEDTVQEEYIQSTTYIDFKKRSKNVYAEYMV